MKKLVSELTEKVQVKLLSARMLSNQEHGDIVQTVLITAIFVAASVFVGQWIMGIVNDEIAIANKCLDFGQCRIIYR